MTKKSNQLAGCNTT